MKILLTSQMAKQIAVFLSVLAYFQSAQIIPDVLEQAPKKFLKVSYGNVKVDRGNELTPTQVKAQPLVEWEAKDDKYYTIIMIDADVPSRNDPQLREVKHWLVANIPGNNIDQGEVVAAYVGSGPSKGTGLHRYIFLLYKQPGKLNIEEPHVANNTLRDRLNFKAAKYAEKYHLGRPLAGNFYQAQYDDYVPIVHQQLNIPN